MGLNLSGLKRFEAVLKQTKENIKGKGENSFVGEKIKVAKETIADAYDGIPHTKVVVEKKNAVTYSIKVVDTQKRPTIAFDEFGTGEYAKGSYKGDLPKQSITFWSSKQKHTVPKWVYYYNNPKTKVTHGGIKGWMFGKTFSIGNNASNRMYYACKLAKKRIRSGQKWF